MLSNKDFLGMMEDGGGKKKFGLDQVKQWDQQNENQYKKSALQAQKRKEEREGKSKSDDSKDDSGYRDRAQERRMDANPDYDPQFKIAETLDAQQTQYLGGDTEHTHLVKGLDYALLRKIRKQQEQEGESMGSSLNTVEKIVSRPPGMGSDVQTKTSLGFNIKRALRSSVGCSKVIAPSESAAVLQRKAFEYDVDIMCEDELPTTVLRSKELAADMSHLFGHSIDTDKRTYITPPHILEAISAALQTSSLNKKKFINRKKDLDVLPTTKTQSSMPQDVEEISTDAKKSSAPAAINIFDDIDSSTYTPSVSTNVTPAVESKLTHDLPLGKASGNSAYFGSSTLSTDEGDNNACSEKTSEEEQRMAPVLEILRAQKVKEHRESKLKEASSSSTKMVVEEGVAHRDILGGSLLGPGNRMGDSMAASSSYDVYPESGDFETYDSDDENSAAKSVGSKKSKSSKMNLKDAGDRKRQKTRK